MVVAQTILAFPIVSALCHSAIVNVPAVIRQAARTLDATPSQEALVVIKEARYGIMAGETVRVTSRRGQVEIKAKVTGQVPAGLIWMAFHSPQLDA
jgi:ABC-type tungstate transport system substrate-binding protein